MKVYVVRTGYGMSGYYGSAIQVHETDLSLEEFVRQFHEKVKDYYYEEPEFCPADQNLDPADQDLEGGTTDTYVLVGEESDLHFIPEE